MEIFLIILLSIGCLVAWNKYKKAKALKLGKEYIHPNYPNVDNEEVLEVLVAGHYYYKRNGTPKTGDLLLLIRDPNNEYDKNAIKFVNMRGKQIGHVPKERNLELAEKMDQGVKYFGVAKKSPISVNNRNLLVKIFRVKNPDYESKGINKKA